MRLETLKKKSITEVLAENKVLKNWQNTTLKDFEECGKHDYCDYCNLCAGQAQSQYGDYKKPAENCCYMAKVRHDLAKKMIKGYDPLNGEEFESVLKKLPKATVELQRIYDTKG